MKKKILILLGGIIAVILICICIFFLNLRPVGKSNESVIFTVNNGDSKTKILDNLKDAKLIRSKYASLIYIVLTGKSNLQAGTYDFTKDMSTQDIITSLHQGKIVSVKRPSISVTFKEGITLKEYMRILADNTDLEYDEIIKDVNNREYLKELISDYWFLTDDILDNEIYYPLEGYLFPETYEFFIDTTLDQAIRKMLNVTNTKLSAYQDEIEDSPYSIHELLTIASIIEKEANSYEDRTKVSQVIYKRLNLNMSLGMDVTSYYGVQKDLKENNITISELNDNNPYNTRLVTFIGLPVGAICNPGIDSIKAALNPADTDYIYFFADVSTGIVHFTSSAAEFENFKKIYR